MNMSVFLRKPIAFSSVLALALLAGAARSLPAQTASAGPAAPAASSDPAAKEKPAPQAAAASGAPSAEGFKLGAYEAHSEFELGYRWSSDIKGDDRMFRSQVNLFDGARLLNSHLSLRSEPGTGLFDRMDLSLNNWGDPYNTMRLNLSRTDLYQFQASYRNLNYYNFISTFANPLFGQGNSFAQHNLDVNYRVSNFELRLFPNRRIVPFVGYSRSASSGPGFTTVSATANEFLLGTEWLYSADEFRGGVQFNYPWLNLTLEQGYRYLRNDTAVTDAGQPQGNEPNRTFLGQVIRLNGLDRGYHGRTKLPTTRILAKYSPLSNLHMVGRYMYTMGDVDSDMGQIETGNFVDTSKFLVYGAAADGFNGRAKSPNHNGSFLIEYSPSARVTLSDNVDTLNYHVTGAGLLSTLFLNASSLIGPSPSTSVTTSESLSTEFAFNQVRNQAEMEYEVGYGFSAHMGHRYTFVDVLSNDSEDETSSERTRRAVFAGLTYRPGGWLRLGLDYEKNKTSAPFTRTDLYDYDQFDFDWRVGSWRGISLNGRVAVQRNSNPNSDIAFTSHDRNYIAGISWEPNGRLSLSADYSRSDLLSELLIVVPQNFQTLPSIFDERISGIGGRLALGVYKGSTVEMGYRGIINRGTAPIEFHQPYLSLWIPMRYGFAFKPAWQYYGYSSRFAGSEDFQTHQLTFALVYTR